MTGLEDMTAKQLLELHNSRAPEDQKLSSWKGKKSELVERVRALGVAAAEAVARKSTENTIGASVRRLLQDETLGYDDIVRLVKAAHPEAETTPRSIASVASVLRRKGVEVPSRRGAKAVN